MLFMQRTKKNKNFGLQCFTLINLVPEKKKHSFLFYTLNLNFFLLLHVKDIKYFACCAKFHLEITRQEKYRMFRIWCKRCL